MAWRDGILFLILLLSACSSSKLVPVEERTQHLKEGDHRYRVVKGDTLYSIAWRYGLDYQRFALANDIPPPYRIRPGQVLLLAMMGNKTAKIKKNNTLRRKKKAKKQALAHSEKLPPKVNVRKKPLKLYWRWPIKGRISKGFSLKRRNLNQGIDIKARYGQPVAAAASGLIVYAGNSVKGYGNLVIIKHNSRYLSAYAHNRRIKVKEGGRVKVGDIIAEAGRDFNGKTVLHFEIRKQGQPINPLKLLPKKQ